MTTLITICKMHKPMVEAISTISVGFDSCEQFTFCMDCEQNISRSSWYDEDRGTRWMNWAVML